MKDQYFGDVNDYRKYGLLRVLTRRSGLSLGVCWLLTPDDGSTDGEFRRYLSDPLRWRTYDPDLYDQLRRLLESGIHRTVRHAREWALLPRTVYVDTLLDDRLDRRDAHFVEIWATVNGCDLVFFDPDNGLEVPSTKRGTRGSSKFLYWTELREAYANGHSVIVYQHFPRIQRQRFISRIADQMANDLRGATVIAFESANVVFLLAAQPTHAASLRVAAQEAATIWLDQIRVSCDR